MLAKILISSDQVVLDEKIEQLLQPIKITKNHPDLLIEDTEKLNLEQAKKIKNFFTFKPYQAQGRVVVIKNITEVSIEAQNALLKTLEEIPLHSLILITTNQESIFLPTILSRCEIIKFNAKFNTDESQDEIKQFVGLSVQDRFYYIEKIKEKDQFLLDVITYYQLQLSKSSDKIKLEQTKQFLEICLEVEKWSMSNVNIRGILEYLALKLP